MIDASDLYEGARVLIKTREQFPTSLGWPADAKLILGEVVTIIFFNDVYFKAKGFKDYFPLTVISSIVYDEDYEIKTDSIDSFIDLI